jgi:hypothetical protein
VYIARRVYFRFTGLALLFTLCSIYFPPSPFLLSRHSQPCGIARSARQGAATHSPRLEGIMTKQNLSYIAVAAAALVFGAALLPASASAQTRNPNDGGQVVVAPGAKLDSGSKPAATQTYYGRNANDGGVGAAPAPAQVSAATPKPSKKPAAPAPVHLGRNANDGGSIN